MRIEVSIQDKDVLPLLEALAKRKFPAYSRGGPSFSLNIDFPLSRRIVTVNATQSEHSIQIPVDVVNRMAPLVYMDGTRYATDTFRTGNTFQGIDILRWVEFAVEAAMILEEYQSP